MLAAMQASHVEPVQARKSSMTAIDRPVTMAMALPRRTRNSVRSGEVGGTITASGRSAISTSVPSKSRNSAQSARSWTGPRHAACGTWIAHPCRVRALAGAERLFA